MAILRNTYVQARSIPIVGLISVEFISLLGNQIAAVAIPILILQSTHSPLIVGIAGSGNIIPIILAALIGGKAIDRFGAWIVSVLSDLLSCISVLALPLAFMFFKDVPSFVIFLLVFIGALFDPSGTSSRQILIPSLSRLARKPLTKINSYRGGLENGADFLGPVLGVGIISIIGTTNTFFMNAASFLICVIIFIFTVPRKQTKSSFNESCSPLLGVRFVFENNKLRALALIGMLSNFVILPFLGLLLPVLALQKFESTMLLGICLSVFGVAATIGSFAFSKISQVLSLSVIYYFGMLITAVAIILCATVETQIGVIICVTLAGSLLGASNPLEQTILQKETPIRIAGKVFTSLTAIRFAAGPLGLLFAGIITEISNVDIVLILGGGLLFIGTVFSWYSMPLHDMNKCVGENS